MGLCELCGRPTTSKYGVCRETDECRRTYARRAWRALNPYEGKGQPCEVCGGLVVSKYGVCRRTRQCRNLLRVKHRAGWRVTNPVPTYPDCKVCGQPSRSAAGVCTRTPECRLAYQRVQPPALAAEARRKPCEVCGRPTNSRLGVCQETAECLSEYGRRLAPARRSTALNPCVLCGTPTNSRVGVCTSTPECIRERRNKYLELPGRPCRYRKAGCTEYAKIGSRACAAHYVMDMKRDYERHRERLTVKLAAAQNGVCPWCIKPLPGDLVGVHIDHIIPKASGAIIEDEWNLQVLHGVCNMSKNARITPLALALAAEHGITLTVTVPQPGEQSHLGRWLTGV